MLENKYKGCGLALVIYFDNLFKNIIKEVNVKMAKRVFFSFDYEDVKTFRVNVVRNHYLTKDRDDAGFFDASIWEDAKKHGDISVKRLINSGLENTSVTCVLIGSETWQRRWVRYEILKSYDRGNSLFGVHINKLPDKNQETFKNGLNPFDYLGFIVSNDGKTVTYYEHDGKEWEIYQDLKPNGSSIFDKQHWGRRFKLSDWVPCHDWVKNDGYNNFVDWIENADSKAGK